MSRLTDIRLLDLIEEALQNGARNIGGYVQWKRLPAEWLRKNLENQTQLSVVQRMLAHVQNGDEIDQVVERRGGHLYESHFDFRFQMDGLDVYIETVLKETKTGPTISIVSMHPK